MLQLKHASAATCPCLLFKQNFLNEAQIRMALNDTKETFFNDDVN